jgi:hypothetical protein
MARHWWLNRQHDIFVDRGDPVGFDWNAAALTIDAAWHDLDCSGIVPAGAKAILFYLHLKNNTAQENVMLRKKGNVNTTNMGRAHIQVTNMIVTVDMICPCDANRFVEYNASNGGAWGTLYICVKGWLM